MALLEGCLWEEALRVLHLRHRTDLLETHLLPALLEAQSSQLVLLETLREKFNKHSSRLVVVRETKRKKQAAILGRDHSHTFSPSLVYSRTCSRYLMPFINLDITLSVMTPPFVIIIIIIIFFFFLLEGTYAVDEKDADLFSDTSSVTGRSAISSLNASLPASAYSKATG